jgi:flagellar hook assembly protein FlgD
MIKLFIVLLMAFYASQAIGEIVYGESQVFALGAGTSVQSTRAVSAGVSLAAAPNPFRPSTLITVNGLTAGAKGLSLAVYSSTGRKLTDLQVPESIRSGQVSVAWNGTDSRGNRLPSGVYFARLTAGSRIITHKLAYCR